MIRCYAFWLWYSRHVAQQLIDQRLINYLWVSFTNFNLTINSWFKKLTFADSSVSRQWEVNHGGLTTAPSKASDEHRQEVSFAQWFFFSFELLCFVSHSLTQPYIPSNAGKRRKITRLRTAGPSTAKQPIIMCLLFGQSVITLMSECHFRTITISLRPKKMSRVGYQAIHSSIISIHDPWTQFAAYNIFLSLFFPSALFLLILFTISLICYRFLFLFFLQPLEDGTSG